MYNKYKQYQYHGDSSSCRECNDSFFSRGATHIAQSDYNGGEFSGGLFYNGRRTRSSLVRKRIICLDLAGSILSSYCVSLQADIFCGAVLWAYTSPRAKTPNGNDDTRNRTRNGKRGFVLCARFSAGAPAKKKRNNFQPRIRHSGNRKTSTSRLFVAKLIWGEGEGEEKGICGRK